MDLYIYTREVPKTARNKRIYINTAKSASSPANSYSSPTQTIDTSNFVKLTGETTQTIAGIIKVTGEIYAKTDKLVYHADNANLVTVDWTGKIMKAAEQFTLADTVAGNISASITKSGSSAVNLSTYINGGSLGGSLIFQKTAGTVAIRSTSTTYTLNVGGTVGVSALYSSSYVGTSNFIGGITGSGWQVEPASGNWLLTIDNLVVRKTMQVYELIIDKIRATNGSLWVSDSARLGGVGPGNVCATDGDVVSIPFVVNDIVRCQQWTGRTVKYYTAVVISIDGSGVGQTFTLDIIDGSDTPEIGDDIVRIGNTTDTTRQASIYLTASDSNAPYMDMMDEVNSADFTGKIKLRIGKLTGINDSSFGGNLSGFGLYANNVYLKGNIYATAGNIGGWTINSTYLAKDTGTNATSCGIAPGDYPFFAGATYANRAGAPFRVSTAGVATMTGATIQTAGSGKRIMIDSATNTMTFWPGTATDVYYKIDASNDDYGICATFKAGLYRTDIYPGRIRLYLGTPPNGEGTTSDFDVDAFPGAQLKFKIYNLQTQASSTGLKPLYINRTDGNIYSIG